jgi:DNA-binding transcriptional LysR family regulator
MGALVAFEAAARYESFSRAADELALTEGAISRQISALEDYLGLHLFLRIRQRVVLTDIGRSYYANISDDLERLERNTRSAMACQDGRQVLELAVIPTFAAKWLIPQLATFRERHPDVIVNLSDRPLPFPFGGTVFHAAVHYEHPAWAGNVQRPLFDEELVAVCSPSLFGGKRKIGIEQLVRHPLLSKHTREDAWPRWFQAAGYPDLNSTYGPRYDLFSMLIQAAVSGMGIALAPRLYVQDELAAGSLVMPVDVSIRGLKRYCVVYPEHKQIPPALAELVDWLEASARSETPVTADAN